MQKVNTHAVDPALAQVLDILTASALIETHAAKTT